MKLSDIILDVPWLIITMTNLYILFSVKKLLRLLETTSSMPPLTLSLLGTTITNTFTSRMTQIIRMIGKTCKK